MTGSSECCGCCTYKTGITVLATFSIIGSLIRIVLGGLILPQCNNDSNCNAAGIVYIIGGVVVFFSAILLLVGLCLNRTGFLVPYMVLMFINAISSSILGIIILINGLIFNGIYVLCISLLDYYFAYCVLAYRKKVIAQNLIRTGLVTAPPTVGVNLGYIVGTTPVYPTTGYPGQTGYPGAAGQGYQGYGGQTGYPGSNQPAYSGTNVQGGYGLPPKSSSNR